MNDETDNVENESVCGETVDHDQVITFAGEGSVHWRCEQCGAEWWEAE